MRIYCQDGVLIKLAALSPVAYTSAKRDNGQGKFGSFPMISSFLFAPPNAFVGFCTD